MKEKLMSEILGLWSLNSIQNNLLDIIASFYGLAFLVDCFCPVHIVCYYFHLFVLVLVVAGGGYYFQMTPNNYGHYTYTLATQHCKYVEECVRSGKEKEKEKEAGFWERRILSPLSIINVFFLFHVMSDSFESIFSILSWSCSICCLNCFELGCNV